MRTCVSCRRELGVAFAQAPICPCCGLPIDGGATTSNPSIIAPEYPPLEETLQRIIARAATEASGETPALPPEVATHVDNSATVNVGPSADALDSVARGKTPANLSGTVDEIPQDGVAHIWSGTIGGSTHERSTIHRAGSLDEAPELIVHRRLLEHRGTSAAGDADYQLIDTIGEGGIGIVYAARQSSIDRTVAVKMLKANENDNEVQRGKFLTEAVITGELDHPNIVPIYDLGATQRGALFYSMKRVRGTPWNKVITRASLVENLETLMKVCDAVAFAHSRHVVHRDLKPENVMLGDFGEVLLMDWGLAVPGVGGKDERRLPSHDPGMGGTPAYMSPEMAVGPLSRIDFRSDVYLLGAILFEIITGKPPHTGATVMACLYAAAQNEIVATDRDDELMRIARRAMSTLSEDRQQSVKEFQAAVRDYQSHAESVLLSNNAQESYVRGQNTGNYQDYSSAVFGFQQALELWSGNDQARRGIAETKAAYAESALKKGDIDLAGSLLDHNEGWHAPILVRVERARIERDQRAQRLTAAKRLAAGLALLVIAVGVGAFLQISRDRDRAVAAEEAALLDRQAAVNSEAQAVRAAQIARDETERARQAKLLADQESNRAKQESDRARDAETKAQALAKAAQEAREAESYEAYVARIGLAAAKIDENSFGTAVQLLDVCEQRHRRWEWGRLTYLCGLDIRSFRAEAPVDAVALSPDGRRVAAGSWDHFARIWNTDGTGEPLTIEYGSQYLHSVAFSPDGRFLAVGGGDPEAFVQIYDAHTGAPLRALKGHDDGVLSVAYSRDGRRLLTSSYDGTARLWDAATGAELKRFLGHNWWVWSAAFAPTSESAPETQIVTAGQDGLTMVWDIEKAEAGPPFRGHDGPVYAACFSPDGKHVVSAGADKRVLRWDPQTVKPFNFETLTDDRPPPPKFDAFDGHTAAVRTVQFSPDGKLIVSGGNDNTVRVWDAASKSVVKTIRGHAGWVRSCAFTPDGQGVASGSHDRRVLLWNLKEYEEQRVIGRRVFQGHSDAVLSAAFSPDDLRLVTGSRDHTARLWDVSTHREVGQFAEGHAFLASQAVFFPEVRAANGSAVRRVVTAGVDGTARVWDVERGVELASFEPVGRSAALAVSHDGRKLLTGNDLNGATLWDAATTKPLLHLEPLGDEVVWTAFSPDDQTLLTGEAGGICRLWNAADGKLLHMLRGQRDRITGAEFLPGGAQLLTASGDNTVAHWDVASGRELTQLSFKHPGPVTSLAVDAAGRTAITGCGDGQVRLWNIADARQIAVLCSTDSSVTVDFSHDGRLAVVVDPARRTVRLWDVAERRERAPTRVAEAGAGGAFLDLSSRGELVWTARFSPDDARLLTVGGNGANLWDLASGDEMQNFSPHGAVASVDASPDGKFIATGSWDHSIKVWSVETGRALQKFENLHQSNVNSVQFSPDSRRILSASDDGTARLCDVESGKPLDVVFKHDGPVMAARFNADGTRIITGGADRKVCVWDARSGEKIRELIGHTWAVNSVAFSPDGKTAASGGADSLALVWNLQTGEAFLRLEGHTAGVSSVAFTSDGARLLTGAQDNLAKLWDARTGKEVLTLKGHTEEITCVAFSHDDRFALTTGRDGTAVLWPAVDWGWNESAPSPLAPDAKTPHNQKSP